jgi:cytochrome c
MKMLTAISLAAALAFSGSALANAELVKKNGCFVCHDATMKKVGPTWKEVAAKNKGQKDAEKMLAETIVKGSKGKYGKIPMPPQVKAQADAAELAKWILTN